MGKSTSSSLRYQIFTLDGQRCAAAGTCVATDGKSRIGQWHTMATGETKAELGPFYFTGSAGSYTNTALTFHIECLSGECDPSWQVQLCEHHSCHLSNAGQLQDLHLSNASNVSS